MRKLSRVASLVVSIATLLALDIPGASAAGFHKYSIADEHSASGAYDGGEVTVVFHAYSTTCVFEPLWLNFTNSNGWVEVGLGHTCDGLGTTYVYAYYSEVGNGSGFLDWVPVSPGTTGHVFHISRSGTHFTINIDNNCNIMCLDLSTVRAEQGLNLQAGMESYDGSAVISSHDHYNLRRYVSGTWAAWAGFDGSSVDGPEMCGGWNSATNWRTSENSPC